MAWTWATPYWLIWLILGFLPVELFAAVKTPGTPDTFSEFVWWVFGIKPRKSGHVVKARRTRKVILAGFCASLYLHFVEAWGPQGIIVFGIGVGFLIAYAVAFEREAA